MFTLPVYTVRWDITLASARADGRRPNTDARDGRLRICHLLLGDPHHGDSTVATHG